MRDLVLFAERKQICAIVKAGDSLHGKKVRNQKMPCEKCSKAVWG